MKSTPENKFRCCSHCHRTLPIEEFYIVNKRTGKHDAYCKSCRRLMNRLRQHPDEQADPEARPRRSLIFKETDPIRRMQLIRQACNVVRESVLRKQKRMREEEEDK